MFQLFRKRNETRDLRLPPELSKKDREKVEEIIRRAVEQNIQPIMHCNGDAAAQQFIDQWEAAVQAAGHGTELRPIMVHAQTVGFDQLDRMKALGMHPSFFVGHCWFWGDTHLKNFGDRGQRISPVRAALDRGLTPNFHQDCPVTRPEMLHSIWCAVNRVTRNGVKIGPDQAVTPMEAPNTTIPQRIQMESLIFRRKLTMINAITPEK